MMMSHFKWSVVGFIINGSLVSNLELLGGKEEGLTQNKDSKEMMQGGPTWMLFKGEIGGK